MVGVEKTAWHTMKSVLGVQRVSKAGSSTSTRISWDYRLNYGTLSSSITRFV